MIHEVIHTKLHLDAAFFNTLRYIFIPGKLTSEYFKGKHKRYAHPMRLFLVLGVFCFALIQGKILHSEKSEVPHLSRGDEMVAQFHLAEGLETASKKWLQQYPQPEARAVYDSIIDYMKPDRDSFLLNGISLFYNNNKNVKFQTKDVVTLSDAELCKKYDIHGFFSQLAVKQGRKSFLEGEHLAEQMFHQLFYTLVLMLPFVALFMKLLYWRQGRFFIEHFIFLVHYHCFLFLVMTVLMLLSSYTSGSMIFLAFLGTGVFLLLALKKVYQQSFRKTFFKQTILFGFYFFMVMVFFTLNALFAFLTL